VVITTAILWDGDSCLRGTLGGALAGLVQIVVMRRLSLTNLSTALLVLYTFRSVRYRVKIMQGTIDFDPDCDTSVNVVLGALGWSESLGICRCL